MRIGSSIAFNRFPAPTANRGVFVSLKPRKVPCAASAITIGGAPRLSGKEIAQLVHALVNPKVFIENPEPKKSARVSATPMPAASAKEVDMEVRLFLLLQSVT